VGQLWSRRWSGWTTDLRQRQLVPSSGLAAGRGAGAVMLGVRNDAAKKSVESRDRSSGPVRIRPRVPESRFLRTCSPLASQPFQRPCENAVGHVESRWVASLLLLQQRLAHAAVAFRRPPCGILVRLGSMRIQRESQVRSDFRPGKRRAPIGLGAPDGAHESAPWSIHRRLPRRTRRKDFMEVSFHDRVPRCYGALAGYRWLSRGPSEQRRVSRIGVNYGVN
jgi:hypothetical protein